MAEENIKFPGMTESETYFVYEIRKLKNKAEAAFEVIKGQDEIINHYSKMFDLTFRSLQRLDEVYYHVFPERLGQDVRFREQMDALMNECLSGGKKPPS